MDTLLAGAELDDVPVFEVCGSRLVGFLYVTVVPSEETVLILGVETLEGVNLVVRITFGRYVLRGMPDLVSMPSSHSVDPRPRSSYPAWSKRYLRAGSLSFALRSISQIGELD